MAATRLTYWLSQFCCWHEKFKTGTLGMDLMPSYMQARLDLNAILVLAQRLDIRANDGARQAVRVARAVPVEFELPHGKISSLTHDISIGGLSALVGEAPAVGTVTTFRLKLGRDIQPVAGKCRVVANIPIKGSVRIAVAFDGLSKEGHSRIETLVIDAVCVELRTMMRCGQSQEFEASPPPPTP